MHIFNFLSLFFWGIISIPTTAFSENVGFNKGLESCVAVHGADPASVIFVSLDACNLPIQI